MKKIQLLTSIILTLLMIIAPQSIALAADDSSQASAVSLISDGFSVDKKAAVFQFDPVAGHAYDPLDKIGAVVFRKLEHHHITLLGFAAPDAPFKRRKAEGERVPGIAVSIFGNEQKIADIKIRIH